MEWFQDNNLFPEIRDDDKFEFVHIVLREVDYPDEERVAYVIPSGIFYDFKFYGKRRSTLEDFI